MDLLEIRNSRGLKQSEIAVACGISQQLYSAIETGKRKPSVRLAKELANVLNFNWTDLYEDTPKG